MKRPRWWVTHQRLPLGFGFLGFLCSQKAFLRLGDVLSVLRRLLGLKPVETEMTRLKITETSTCLSAYIWSPGPTVSFFLHKVLFPRLKSASGAELGAASAAALSDSRCSKK